MKPALRYSSSFKLSYQLCKRQIPNFAQKFQHALELFFQEKSLVNDHQLVKRSLKGLRSFAVTSDIRVVYQKTQKYILLIRVGSHREAYG